MSLDSGLKAEPGNRISHFMKGVRSMKQITKEERNVLLAIIHAETGSDSGKGFHNLYGKSDACNRKAVRMGYANKLSYILAAINTLRGIRGGSRVINYWVEPGSYITYFDIVLESDAGIKQRLQVSFHTPSHVPGYEKLYRLAGTGRKTKWTGEIHGSIEACRIIGEYLNTQ